MAEYITKLSKKLPKRTNINITQDVNIVYSSIQGFAMYTPVIGFSIGYKF